MGTKEGGTKEGYVHTHKHIYIKNKVRRCKQEDF